MFNKSLLDYNDFKEIQTHNFKLATKMQVDLGMQLQQIKDVIQEMQE
jgi:hypothetical protein